MKAKTFYKLLHKRAELYNGNKMEVITFLNWCQNTYSNIHENTLHNKTKWKRKKFNYEGKKTWYHEVYLKSEKWQEIKNTIWNTRKHECQACGFATEDRSKLDNHHTRYTQKILDGENLKKILLLCRECHELVHKYKEERKITYLKATNMVLLEKRKLI